MDPLAKSPELRPSPKAQLLQKPFFAAYLLCWGWNMSALILAPHQTRPISHIALVLTMAGTLLAGIARRLPSQNVLTAGIIIVMSAFGILSLGVNTGIPCGAFQFSKQSEPQWLGVPWIWPLYWMALAIGSREISRLPLRPWRKTTNYGYWMIVLSLVLVLTTVTIGEPVLGKEAQYWQWRLRPGAWNWYGMPWSNWLGIAVSFFVIYVLATPWLINKQPVKQPVDWHPFFVLVSLEVYFTLANGLAGYTAAAALGVCTIATVTFFSIRGVRG